MIFHVPPEDPPACPHCAALEAEVARLRENAAELETINEEFFAATNCGPDDLHRIRQQRDDARALLRELAEEAQSILDHLTVRAAILADDPRLQRLRSVLRRVDAEAGEAR